MTRHATRSLHWRFGLRTWQKTYPDIDFPGRLAWWRDHWGVLVRSARITMAEAKNEMVGFVTVDPGTLYLDQIVVAPDARAIAFYQKEGFIITGGGINPRSGRPVHHMRWRP
jgi:putative acetyltransferase